MGSTKLSGIYSNGMVLQRKKEIVIVVAIVVAIITIIVKRAKI